MIKEATEGTNIDKKCPFTGNFHPRKMQKTSVTHQDCLHYIQKHNHFEKHQKNMSVHLFSCFRDVQIGDIATVGQC
ncbi:unnamed protein product [Nyctereutes procyonoides]|uniref:(raccoon dog) hypothetical protein n=1 Tax=Nyctereutes procyonoides TaxID=34880 RepID=A0A811YX08_NYCPR|nr:unnamed protein product [Nyctereutes procyonoides]